jgi:hypothetical protein
MEISRRQWVETAEMEGEAIAAKAAVVKEVGKAKGDVRTKRRMGRMVMGRTAPAMQRWCSGLSMMSIPSISVAAGAVVGMERREQTGSGFTP